MLLTQAQGELWRPLGDDSAGEESEDDESWEPPSSAREPRSVPRAAREPKRAARAARAASDGSWKQRKPFRFCRRNGRPAADGITHAELLRIVAALPRGLVYSTRRGKVTATL